MAQVHVHIPSFNAGELSPLLGARFAVEKVQSGCRRLRNFIPHVHGPAFRRPGTEYMGASAGNGSKSSLRGFNFSTTTGAVLEFHPSGLSVWSNGVAVPLVGPAQRTLPGQVWPYASESVCAELQIAQVNDVCYIVHADQPPRKLTRFADNDWRLTDIDWTWPPLGDENTRSTEIATPTVTQRGSDSPLYEWPEFSLSAGDNYTFSIGGGFDTSSVAKVAHLSQWVDNSNPTRSGWVKRKTLTWKGSAPTPATGTVDKDSRWRVDYTDTTATLPGGYARIAVGATNHDLNIVTVRPQRAAVTVPAGDWQMTAECTATLPAGAKLIVEKKTGSKWATAYTFALKPGQTIIIRGDKLTAATDFRFIYGGAVSSTKLPASRGMYKPDDSPAVAKFESIEFPASTDVTIASSGTNGTGRTLTASAALFKPAHVGSYWQISHRRGASDAEIVTAVPTIVAASTDPIRVSGKWEVFSYGVWDATLYLERKVSGVWEVVRSWVSRKDRNVIADGQEDSEVEMRLRISAGTGEAATGADHPRFVLETSEARVTGLVKVTAIGGLDATGKSTTATADVLTDLYSTDPTALWTEGAFSGVNGYPRGVALHGQRLWFGGTKAEPMRLWGSEVADYENFRRTTLDDSSVSFTPAAQQANRIQWMVSHGQNLVFGTNGDEWTVSGGTDGSPISPTSVLIQRRSGYGSQYQGALLLGEVIVFVQRGGRKMREVAPRADGIEWTASDLTVLAEHIGAAGIVQITAMHHPFSILWAITGDGTLLGMTFEQEQNVFAWHVHTTAGQFESVGVVYGVDADEVWVQVNRNGTRTIERLDPRVMGRLFSQPEKLIYSDCAKRITSATATNRFTGLDHLEGRDVTILGDGAPMTGTKVIGGAVQLDRDVSTVVVGLPFTSELQPMRLEIPLRDGTAQHRNWKAARIALYVHESLGGEVADSPTSRFERLNYRDVATPMDAVPPLYSGERETTVEASTRAGADAIVRTSEPMPLNIGSLTWKGDVSGE